MRIVIAILFLLVSITSKAQLMPSNIVEVYDDLAMMPYEEKFKKLDELILNNPNEPWYYWIAASIYGMKGDDSLVIESFEKALEVDADFSAGHGSYARFLSDGDNQNLDLALQHINRAIELDSDAIWHIDKGEILRKQKKYELAIQEADYALSTGEIDPMPAVQLIVQSFYDSGDKETLREYVLGHDLTSFGGFMDTRFDMLLGKLYQEYGDTEKACMCFNAAADPYVFMDEEVPAYIADELEKCK